MKLQIFLFIAFLFAVSTQVQAQSFVESLPEFEYVYKDTVVKGGSNYDLVTRIYLPKGEGPWPLIITRTPYFIEGRTMGDNIKEGQEYARHGLGYILQYCRGKGGSEGTYEPNIYEREDGLALVNWVADQSWSRSIGLAGASYTALTSWIIADSLPDKVKGIYLHHYGVDRHLSAYKDGLFRQDILTSWAIDNATELKSKPVRDREEPYYKEARYMPQEEMDVDLLGAKLSWYRDWITHPDYNDPYWQSGIWAELRSIPAHIKVPMTIVAGLFDHHLEGTLLGYELLPEETKKNSRLIVGSWNHSYQVTPVLKDQKHAKDFDVAADQFEWLYKVVAEGKVPKGEVQAYFVGMDEWKKFDTWPIKTENQKTYYLSNQVNSSNTKAFNLATEMQASSKFAFDYDPQNPVMSVGGETLFGSTTRRGSKPQPEIGYRDDVLFFLSDPYKESLAIAGPIKAVIYMSSDCDDTSLTYKVSEVFADGSTYNLRSGITTLAYRNDRFGNRQSYTPNEIVALEIETLPINWQIQPGSRIRIDITSSNFPEYSIHSNYAGVWSEQTQTRVAHQTIYNGINYPSRISIPFVK